MQCNIGLRRREKLIKNSQSTTKSTYSSYNLNMSGDNLIISEHSCIVSLVGVGTVVCSVRLPCNSSCAHIANGAPTERD